MSPDLPQLRSNTTPTGDDSHVWPPPRYSAQDRRTRLVGGTIVGAFLLVWMVAYWPNVTMRLVTLGLLIMIAWIAVPALFDNAGTSPQGRIVVDDEYLQIEAHEGDAIVVAWKDVALAQWRQDEPDKFGLWLFDGNGNTLAHLDRTLLPDQGDAKSFVDFAKGQARLTFEIRWTQV